MPGRGERREAEGHEASREIRAEAEALRGYRRWEFHPTKQYVRQHGWLEPVQSYLERRAGAQVGDHWTYLTLPGEDALDVGFFHQKGLLDRRLGVWETLAICDRYFGAQVVNRIGQPMKGWAQCTIEDLVFQPEHPLTSNFPYEVINLDYCGPLLFGANDRLQVGRHVTALRRIFALQRRCSFMLLLTTKNGRQAFSHVAREMMTELLQWNIENDEAFRSRYQSSFGSEDAVACTDDFPQFAQLVLPKVIADCAREWAYEIEEVFAARYVRDDGAGNAYHMICHTFCMTPIGRSGASQYAPDPELSSLPGQASLSIMRNRVNPDDRDRADSAYTRFSEQLLTRTPVDVTLLLENDSQLNDQLKSEALALDEWWERM